MTCVSVIKDIFRGEALDLNQNKQDLPISQTYGTECMNQEVDEGLFFFHTYRNL